MNLLECLQEFPFIAITRGIQPEEALDCAAILYGQGFRILENPLNSPRPYYTIELLANKYKGKTLIGAGTVTTVAEVHRVKEAGGELIISPNCNPEVIETTKKLGMVSIPGIATPSEAFVALSAGADALKLFPAEVLSPQFVKALRAVLPKQSLLLPVGSIDERNWQLYYSAGAAGFGLGSSLYRSGCTQAQLEQRAIAFADSWREIGCPD